MSKILLVKEVEARSGKSRTTLWRDVRAGRFPAPVKVGRNRIGWLEKPQRFCSPRCRREHEAGLQAWAREQEAAGRVTKAHLQRARSPDA